MSHQFKCRFKLWKQQKQCFCNTFLKSISLIPKSLYLLLVLLSISSGNGPLKGSLAKICYKYRSCLSISPWVLYFQAFLSEKMLAILLRKKRFLMKFKRKLYFIEIDIFHYTCFIFLNFIICHLFFHFYFLDVDEFFCFIFDRRINLLVLVW